ncbi:ShlB/FhaC/HecB family hemolysin secretion/activation protein [Pseudomonas nitroreducens]|uniref:ShlB/FhaC/HecB family hemolysin secretion/activation protein n=2 Tax=Pseudomonas nitroreducens TaxID=46680 RepID=A0A6G6J373_PSENT|nr:ShlB/FhaC/HecB family hemolysin secretion/activation protein [Pseudomonas nitroreducens]NNN28445.1 ShlB/FhaC/HecB family hemolysin secretion/activation protein [Pseudomonas nitroreducens]QIE89510.1 ShlB/FhaC/HecB family hemolysin secretion/activation protein [Pseudomonas nitroreducens]
MSLPGCASMIGSALRTIGRCSLLLFAALWPGAGNAAGPGAVIENAVRQADRLQRDSIERLQQQQQQDRSSAEPPTHLQVPAGKARELPEGPCRDIRSIEVRGAKLIRPSSVDLLVQPYQGKCLGVREIEQVLSAITAAYIAKGYVAARAYLPAQDLSGGTLTVDVEEGRVETIRVEDGGAGSISVPNVAPGVVGKPLNLRDLEQALDQINRLPSNDAVMDIAPGSAPGDSVVLFSNHPMRPARLNLTYDNYGQDSTGQNQAGANLALDNPLGFNDFLSLTHRRAVPYDAGSRASYLSNLSYVVPFGYATVSFNASDTHYASHIRTAGGTRLRTSGDSSFYSLRTDYVAWRGQQSLWNLSATLTRKDFKNYLEDIYLDVSSRKLTVLDLDSSFTTQLLGGSFTVNAGVSRGLKLFDALDDPSGLPDYAPRAQYTAFKYGANWFRPFLMLGQSWSFTSQFTGQKAQDVLYGSEQILVGSLYSVRGFEDQSLSGDNGWFLRNQLNLHRSFALRQGLAGQIRPYVALDHGKVWNREPGLPQGKLTGAALGVSTTLGVFNLDVFHAWPLEKPDFLDRPSDSTYFSASLSF